MSRAPACSRPPPSSTSHQQPRSAASLPSSPLMPTPSLSSTPPPLSGVRRPTCLRMVVVSRLRTAPRLHFICPLLSPAAARSNTLLFSNKTLSQLTLYPPPSERPDCSWTVTRDSQPTHTPAKPTVCRYRYKTLLPQCIDCQTVLNSLVWSAPLFVSYRRDKSVKDKDKYKDKTVKETPSCFPPVQIVLQVSHWDHHHIDPSLSLTRRNRSHLFTEEHTITSDPVPSYSEGQKYSFWTRV